MTNQPSRSFAPPALARAQALFTSAFGTAPLHVAAAPGRVNLIGEHTDYSGGFVLPIALDRLCIAAISPAASPRVSRLISEHAAQPFHVDLSTLLSPERWLALNNRPADGWTDYVVGVLSLLAAQAASIGRPTCNLDIAIASDVPLGGGLSSSASLEVSVAVAAASAWRLDLPAKACARLARQAEHAFAQVPCGIMDQYISALGRVGHALLIDCRSEECEHIPMPPADRASILIVNSNVRHSLASGEYAQRRDACIRAASVLGVRELRDADERAVASSTRLLMEPGLFPIARHVVTENTRTLAAAAALQQGDLPQVGSLMNASHASLRDDYRVSCPELDSLVAFAAEHAGVFGARMTGGGFGGCMVALCRPEEADSAADEILHRYRARHQREATAFVTTAQDGARLIASEKDN